MNDELQNLLNDVNADQQDYIDALKEKEHPEAKAIKELSAELRSLRTDFVMEQQRAQSAESANKRYSFYIAVSSGIVSAVVSICMAYLFS